VGTTHCISSKSKVCTAFLSGVQAGTDRERQLDWQAEGRREFLATGRFFATLTRRIFHERFREHQHGLLIHYIGYSRGKE